MSIKSTNPFTGKIIEEFEELSDYSIQKILSGSASAFETWRKSDFDSRKTLLRKTADVLQDNIKELSLIITNEMGKPVTESVAEIEKCAWVCKYYAENGETFLGDEPVETDAHKSYVSYEPLGTILGIMPWNFPFWQVFRFAVPALMAGNTVLLKHASNVQRCAREIERVFSKSGFPGDVFRNLSIGSGKVGRIIENDAVKGVSLTGSELAGQKVAEIAGRNLKKTLLELGGSNAFIVLEDADIEKAAEIGVRARMMNAGQSCIAAKRFIVHRNVGDNFLERFGYYLGKLKQGDPANYETNIGPLASVKQAMAVEDQVNGSVKMGARVITGGKRTEAFYAPSILLDVHPGMPVFDEEVFGPVAPVSIVRDTSEALTLARTTKFGLGVSLFTNDLEKAGKIAADFKDGAVFINDLVKSDPRLPFGGTGRSGYGRELSVHGIREFVNVKTVYAKKFN
jgi:succinate-semialdehyde dehydrogenase/glutarate-semialdehyde dehydrogenase